MKKAVLPLPGLRRQPFLWVTWLTGLLSGEQKCRWPLLIRSRYEIPRPSISERLQAIIDDHGRLVKMRVAELEHRGLYVTVEDENTLSKVGQTGTKMTGKPDIAVIERDSMSYEDCKTGKRRDSDHVQVLLYGQLAKQNRVKKEISGNVVYSDGVESVDMGRLSEIKRGFIDLMQLINDGDAPQRPNPLECRFCKVRDYCEERSERDAGLESSLDEIIIPF